MHIHLAIFFISLFICGCCNTFFQDLTDSIEYLRAVVFMATTNFCICTLYYQLPKVLI